MQTAFTEHVTRQPLQYHGYEYCPVRHEAVCNFSATTELMLHSMQMQVVCTIFFIIYHSLLIVYLIPRELSQALSVFMKSNLLEPCNDIVCITDWWATSTTITVWCSMCCQQRRTLWRYHACWTVDIWISSITSNMHATMLVKQERWQLRCIAT